MNSGTKIVQQQSFVVVVVVVVFLFNRINLFDQKKGKKKTIVK